MGRYDIVKKIGSLQNNMTTVLPDEIEAKFYPVDVDAIRKTLAGIGAKCTHPMRLMKRVVFDNIDNPILPVTYIRVRDEGGAITLSAKDYANVDKGHKHQRELMVTVDNFDNTVNLLKIVGLKQTTYQETERETWQLGDCEVCIDRWPGLNFYIEIESPNTEELERVASLLPLAKSKRYEGGIISIYKDEYGWDRSTVMKNIAHLTFDHIPFRHK